MGGNDNPVDQGSRDSLLFDKSEPGFDRYSPILDPDRLKAEYLVGIPLKAPLTGEEVSVDTLKAMIRKAIGDFESSVKVAVNPVEIEDRFDFERADDLMFGTRRLTRWPVVKVLNLKALWPGRMEILTGVTQEIDYPTSWVSLQGDTGLIRIVPNSGTLVNADTNFVSSSGYRAIVLGGMKAWPNMWRVRYLAGFNFDKVPEVVNDLIGIMAAHRLLSMLGPAIFPVAAQSVGIDGMSQGVTTAGPNWLQLRLADLVAQRDRLIVQLKAFYSTDIQFFAF